MAHNASLAVRIRRPCRTGHGRTDRCHGIGAHRLLRGARPAIPHCQVLLSLARRGNNIALRVVSPCEGCGTPDAQLNSQGDPMKVFTTFCCAALALCSAIYAQSPNDHITVHFDTPVIVGETKLPAGDCDIQVMRGSSYSIILVIRSQAGPYTAAVASRLFEDNSVGKGPPAWSSTVAAMTSTSTASCSPITPAFSCRMPSNRFLRAVTGISETGAVRTLLRPGREAALEPRQYCRGAQRRHCKGWPSSG